MKRDKRQRRPCRATGPAPWDAPVTTSPLAAARGSAELGRTRSLPADDPRAFLPDFDRQPVRARTPGVRDVPEPPNLFLLKATVTECPAAEAEQFGCDRLVKWDNGSYYGFVRWFDRGFPVGSGPYAVLSVTCVDETARHDFRDFQAIKSDVIGPEWEAVELYPAESRLCDPSNRFYLFCVPKGVFKWGLPNTSRHVLDYDPDAPAQRPFPTEFKPPSVR